MYFDLNVLAPTPTISTGGQAQSKKGKQPQASPIVSFSLGQINALEAKIDLLVHLGYTIIAFNQIAHKKVDPKTHVNVLDGLLPRLRTRAGIVYLKRLTIVLDEDSEKGFGLTNSSTALFAAYDLLALTPTTTTSFSLACLTHTLPSPLTVHIIALPLTLPRLPFHLKHTQVRAALKNGAVFEIAYGGALGDGGDDVFGAESGQGAKRNWFAAAREMVRVTKGKGIIVSGAIADDANLRAPRDIGNLLASLGLAQDVANAASTKVCKSLVLRAQTRKTYRAVLSEPIVVIPESVPPLAAAVTVAADEQAVPVRDSSASIVATGGHKRPLEAERALNASDAQISTPTSEKLETGGAGDTTRKKKKRKQNKLAGDSA